MYIHWIGDVLVRMCKWACVCVDCFLRGCGISRMCACFGGCFCGVCTCLMCLGARFLCASSAYNFYVFGAACMCMLVGNFGGRRGGGCVGEAGRVTEEGKGKGGRSREGLGE